MNVCWQVSAVVVTLVAWLVIPPTSLAEIGRREAIRRQLVGDSVKTVTTDDLPMVPVAVRLADPTTPPGQAVDPDADDARAQASLVGGEQALTSAAGAVLTTISGDAAPPAPQTGAAGPASGEAAASGAPGVAGASGAPDAAAPPAAGALPTAKDEKAWRDRIAGARATLERDQVLLAAMQSRINALNTDVINRDDPAQQADLRAQLQRAVAERDRLQKQVETDTKAIQTIQDEARRQGVPPGWVR
ncbi:MAG: hypothetical protein R2752_21920 [Vicinamibacterales bacterium]